MKIFLHTGTHWDREWYQTFQGFRFRLVNMMNDLMDGLEAHPDFGVFHADGQTVILEDFLAIEPHQKERLTKHIRSGRIVIGPWYCMPDEFLCSGESIIRNLRRGMRIAGEYGVTHCKNAYICDIFGHAAQTPQIFSGLDLHHTVLGRGTNPHTTPRFFRWTSPDGSDVRVYRLAASNGYGDYTADVCCGTVYDPHPDREAKMQDEPLKARLKAFVDAHMAESNIPIVIAMNALDHDFPRWEVTHHIELLRELYPDAEIYHVSPDEYDCAIDEYIDELPRVHGELAETAKGKAGYLHLITNTLSSRYPLKRENDILQTRMEKWIAPAYAFGLTHASAGYLDLMEKYLLLNHPHDSICGCSIDQVHRDMLYRFDQNRLIGDEIMKTVQATIAGGAPVVHVDGPIRTGDLISAPADVGLTLRLFNPLPYDREETVTVPVTFPKGYRTYAEPFGFEPINCFKLYDADGREVPYGITDIVINRGGTATYTLSLRMKLCALGTTDLLIRSSEMPVRYVERLVTGQRTAENEHIALRVNDDGTVDLTDKKTGATYAGLLAAVDDGEIGDGWYHANPVADRTVLSNAADIEISENNAVRVTYKITQHLRLPVSYTRGGWQKQDWGLRRSEEYTTLDVVHYVTLARGERKLSVKTEIENTAMDHRLRLRLPTGIAGKTYYASQPFCIIPRETDDRPETAEWKEYGIIEKNTAGVVAKYGERGGFAFLSHYGLHECGVQGDGTMDITLFRAFCQTIMTRGEPDGELLGEKLTFAYTLMPLDADTPLSVLARTQDMAAAGIAAYTVKEIEGNRGHSLCRIDGDAFVYSTAAPLSDGMEIRLWNCSDDEAVGELTLPAGYTEAALIELDGREIEKLPVEDGKVRLTAGKWKIVTVACRRA